MSAAVAVDPPIVRHSGGGLETFFNPRSIALFGASDDETNLRGRITRLIVEKGFTGDLYLINPSRRDIGGRRCYASINDVGVGVDLAAFVVPAPQVLPALEDCARLGVKNALIMSSGFADGGGDGAVVQSRIAALGQKSGMRICGPNTVGFYNESAGIAVTFSPAIEYDRAERFTAAKARVGVIAQSGGLGFSLYQRGRHLGLSFSTVVTTGNEVDLTAADFLAHMAADTDTCAILMFLETIRAGDAFVRALEVVAAARKPVVVVKVGRSAAAERATVSHTGSIAGWGAAYDAMFARYGVAVAEDLDRAVAIIAGFVTNPRPRGRNSAIVTVSGGAGALAADRLTAGGFDVPELGAALQTKIAALLPAFASTTNPVDVTGQATRTPAPINAIRALDSSDEVDLIVMAATMGRDVPPVDIPLLKIFLAGEHKPLFFYTYTLPNSFALRALAEAGMVAYTSLDDIAATAGAMLRYEHFLMSGRSAAPTDSRAAAPLGRAAGIIAEHDAKDLLAAAGMTVGRRLLVRREADLTDIPPDFFPVAAKIQSVDIPHKTEANGVRLKIADRAALAGIRGEILASARSYKADARIDGILVEPMAPAGVEMIVGVVRDTLFGPVVTVGAGGITTELIVDVARLLGPVDAGQAMTMLRSLRLFPLLDGYRGAPPADVDALVDLIVRISAFAARATDIREIELNPVLVHPTGAGLSVVDALIVCDPESANLPAPGQIA